MTTERHAASSALSRSLPKTPRQREALEHLLKEYCAKEITRLIGISRERVHIYVSAIYLHYEVASQPELLALFLWGSADLDLGQAKDRPLPDLLQPGNDSPRLRIDGRPESVAIDHRVCQAAAS